MFSRLPSICSDNEQEARLPFGKVATACHHLRRRTTLASTTGEKYKTLVLQCLMSDFVMPSSNDAPESDWPDALDRQVVRGLRRALFRQSPKQAAGSGNKWGCKTGRQSSTT